MELFIELKRNLKIEVHSFIPTKSALAYTGNNFLGEIIGDKNRVCTGETPFDNYFAPKQNEEHIFLTTENVAWLTQEIEGNPQSVSTYFSTNTKITGNHFVCYSQPSIFSLFCLGDSIITWSTSNNLVIVSNNGDSIEVAAKYANSNGLGWVKAVVNGSNIYTKNIEVGVPNSASLEISSLGGYTINTQHWHQLTAFYNQNSNHNEISYEWLIPYAQIRYANAKRNAAVLPTQIGTYPYKLRAINQCGCSLWKTKLFEVKNTPNGGSLYISPSN